MTNVPAISRYEPNRLNRIAIQNAAHPTSPTQRQSGFALVAVIWTLGLITLLGLAVIVGARYRAKVEVADVSTATASIAAESAINYAIGAILTGQTKANIRFPRWCRLPGKELVFITVEEEAGKIDLNSATHATLARLFTALTRSQSEGMRIADTVIEFRNLPRRAAVLSEPSAAPSLAAPSGRGGFITIMQLDQIRGMTPSLFRNALRFVTVSSGRSEPDNNAMSNALRHLLGLDEKPATISGNYAPGSTITIRVDVHGIDRSRFVREALLSLGDGGAQPLVISEWRQGHIDPNEKLLESQDDERQRRQNSVCFKVDTGKAL